MSNITDAINACHMVREAMSSGDCETVEKVLNERVRCPDKMAKGYVKGYWSSGLRLMNSAALKDVPVLKHSSIGGWKCFRIDSDN